MIDAPIELPRPLPPAPRGDEDAPAPTPTRAATDVPPAFYRDDEPPLPPPDDPHRHEWPHSENEGDEGLPAWLIYGLPAFLVGAAVLHAVLIFIVLTAHPVMP